MGRGAGGRLVDTATRLVTEAPVPQPPYNAVLRFRDEEDRPLRQQAIELLSPMIDRGVSPVSVVHPTTDPSIRDVLAELGLVPSICVLEPQQFTKSHRDIVMS